VHLSTLVGQDWANDLGLLIGSIKQLPAGRTELVIGHRPESQRRKREYDPA
jgi:hypothetical protein